MVGEVTLKMTSTWSLVKDLLQHVEVDQASCKTVLVSSLHLPRDSGLYVFGSFPGLWVTQGGDQHPVVLPIIFKVGVVCEEGDIWMFHQLNGVHHLEFLEFLLQSLDFVLELFVDLADLLDSLWLYGLPFIALALSILIILI